MSAIASIRSLAAYSFSHFCVDFACFVMLFHGVQGGISDTQTMGMAFALYNVVAFGLQPLIGFWSDNHPRFPAGIIGCAAVAVGLLLMPFVWISLAVCAFGNALFHVGGGIDSLTAGRGRISRSGVFVSTGALGVAFGTLYGKNAFASALLPLILLCVSAVLIALLAHRPKQMPSRTVFRIASGRPFAAVLLLALCSVAIRAYVGSSLPLAWRTGSMFLMLLPALAAFTGKAAGGFLADALGARRVGVTALVLSVPLLVLGQQSPVIAAAGIILFNCTMAVTLCVLASALPQNPGLAFGLSTLALLCGSLPTFFFRLPDEAVSFVLPALIAVSAVCVFLSTANQKGVSSHEENPIHEQLPV